MIDILLSTYNGARFLAEQLNSILEQDAGEFRLCIRDDGSTDGTIALIDEFARRDGRISLITDDLGNLGPQRSFLELIERSNADTMMLADQDDVWLPGKISVTRAKLAGLESSAPEDTPAAVFTDMKVVDENLNVIADSFWNYQKLDPSIARDWRLLLAQNVVPGCTLMFNRAAKSVILPFALPEMMHDHWIASRVAKYGLVGFLAEPTMLYRQHGENAEGARRPGFDYLAGRAAGFGEKFRFYQRAARVFGGVSAGRLAFNKIWLNLKRTGRR